MFSARKTRSVTGLLAGVLALGAALSAQRPFAHNRLEFSNRVLTDRDDEFPNQATFGGVQAGDGLFKILPATILGRQGEHRISGYRLALAVQRGYQGGFPTRVLMPSMQVYRTKEQTLGGPVLGFKDYDVVDLANPATGSFDSIAIDLPLAGAYTIQVEMDPASSDPKRQNLVRIPALVNGKGAALAILLRGIAGESSLVSFRPTAVLRPSYLERHIQPGRDSYSGSYEHATGAVKMYGMLGQASPRGEIYASLLFDNPTLSLLGTSAGGKPGDPAETQMGPGAYDTDIATGQRRAATSLFVHAEQFHDTTSQYTVVPLIVSLDPAGPNSELRVGNARLRIDPSTAHLGALFAMGYWGPLSNYTAGGSAGFVQDKLGAWVMPGVVVAPDPAMKGQSAWMQGLVLSSVGDFLATTNVVRLTLN